MLYLQNGKKGTNALNNLILNPIPLVREILKSLTENEMFLFIRFHGRGSCCITRRVFLWAQRSPDSFESHVKLFYHSHLFSPLY